MTGDPTTYRDVELAARIDYCAPTHVATHKNYLHPLFRKEYYMAAVIE